VLVDILEHTVTHIVEIINELVRFYIEADSIVNNAAVSHQLVPLEIVTFEPEVISVTREIVKLVDIN
jgi:hypothetical protein